MKKRKKVLFLKTWVLLIVITSLIWVGARNNQSRQSPFVRAGFNVYGATATSLAFSDFTDVNFAGERMPLEREDVQHKFDRQLFMNTYPSERTVERVKRALRWKPVILPILKQEGIPTDFFYLAVAESFLENVTSPVGAKGFWQFMSFTGREYGLEVNREVDERYDPVKSTIAACTYLKRAYGKFGNWTLAAASYNMGMGGISRQLDKQRENNYYDLRLNPETGAYIYRIVALKSLLENQEHYGYYFTEKDVQMEIKTKEIKVKKSIKSLTAFAKKHHTTVAEIRALNPWLRSSKLTISKGNSYLIKVPDVDQDDYWLAESKVSPPAEAYHEDMRQYQLAMMNR